MSNKKTVRRRGNPIITKLIGIVIIAAALVILLNVGRQVYTMLSLQRQAELVEEELQILRDENASLINTKDKLEDPNYVQTYARGEYMFSKGDERVFYLPGSSEGSE
ncbi:MAG: septum formation initiator family protein [Erysipelotrichaceae bacterium]|nr:septum formation initiator family protein [Erysipelotrichaceae bacterium]